MFTLEAIDIRCTASLRTIDNHFGLPATRSLPSACPHHFLLVALPLSANQMHLCPNKMEVKLSPIEEIRKESSSRVTASDELCLTDKAGVTRIEGNTAFPFSASAIRCTASLRTIVIHLGLRGVIPPFTQPRTDSSQYHLVPSYLLRRVSSHCWSSRDKWVCVALPYLRAASNCCSALTTGSRTPDLSTARVMRACTDWNVRSILQNRAGRASCPCSCRRAASSSLSVSLRWPLQPLPPASGDLRSILSMPRSGVDPTCAPFQLSVRSRCTDASILSCSSPRRAPLP